MTITIANMTLTLSTRVLINGVLALIAIIFSSIGYIKFTNHKQGEAQRWLFAAMITIVIAMTAIAFQLKP